MHSERWTIDNCSGQYHETFTGTLQECWDWLAEHGQQWGWGVLQWVCSGQTEELYPWSPDGSYTQPLYSVRVRYDTTFERYTGTTTWMLMYPEGADPATRDSETHWGEYRRQVLRREHIRRSVVQTAPLPYD